MSASLPQRFWSTDVAHPLKSSNLRPGYIHVTYNCYPRPGIQSLQLAVLYSVGRVSEKGQIPERLIRFS